MRAAGRIPKALFHRPPDQSSSIQYSICKLLYYYITVTERKAKFKSNRKVFMAMVQQISKSKTAITGNQRRSVMNNSKNKMAAPIIITIIIVLYLFLYFGFIISFLNGFWKILLGIIPLALAAVMIYVCVQRINEIKGGEEDDLSQY